MVAFKNLTGKSNSLAITLAILVLPIPGSPYKIMENIFLFLIRLLIILPLPII